VIALEQGIAELADSIDFALASSQHHPLQGCSVGVRRNALAGFQVPIGGFEIFG
jgi:hypothetical protein